MSDTEAELHDMAAKIGVARRWYQGDHYDISMTKRSLAVEAGAVEVTLRQLAKMSAIRRRMGKLPTPQEAEAIYEKKANELKARFQQNG